MKDEAKRRHARAAIGETKGNLKDDSGRTEEVQNKHGPLANKNPGVKNEAPASRDGATELSEHTDEASDKLSLKGTSSKAPSSEDHVNSKMSDNEVIDVRERELEHKQTHGDTESHRKSENTGSHSVAKSQMDSSSQPQLHPDQNTARSVANSPNCDGCKAGEHCKCPQGPGPEARPAVLVKGFPRTPRTDEAVWAAGALGFLLVLLTLSVLHTRLYRHWRTMPSLYWHDPRRDYDSVAGSWDPTGLHCSSCLVSWKRFCTTFFLLCLSFRRDPPETANCKKETQEGQKTGVRSPAQLFQL